jgi:hypothetical protein
VHPLRLLPVQLVRVREARVTDERRVSVYLLGETEPSARADLTTLQIADMRAELKRPNGVVEVRDTEARRRALIPVRHISTVFIHDRETPR